MLLLLKAYEREEHRGNKTKIGFIPMPSSRTLETRSNWQSSRDSTLGMSMLVNRKNWVK